MNPNFSGNLAGTKILLVDDDPIIIKLLKGGLERTQCEIMSAADGEEALAKMAQSPADILITDMSMPNMDGQELLLRIAKSHPETVRMVLTSSSDLDAILAAVNSGRIWGYMQKPWDINQLIMTLEQAIATQKALTERSMLLKTLEHYQNFQKRKFEGFIGESVPMQFVYKAIEAAAQSNASVFITGPSGTGKEVAAAALVNLSRRKDKPFICINCAAIPSELMESEIFGHVKGAFSGAVSNREGAASQANGGTLFFDEIGEMDIVLQAKLLRFIQTGVFQRVGGDKPEKVDVRFICATNREPMQAIADNRLREDLYYRLNVVSIYLPPLAEREEDSLILAHYFLTCFSERDQKSFIGIASDAEKLISEYAWPGNVRQLQNVVHSCVVMSEGPLLTADVLATALGLPLPEKVSSVAEAKPIATLNLSLPIELPGSQEDIKTLAEVEKQVVLNAIAQCGDNIVEAATALGLSPSTVYRKMQIWKV